MRSPIWTTALLGLGEALDDDNVGQLGELVRVEQQFAGAIAVHHDDPTDELGAAWGIKEQLRRLLKTPSLADTHEAKMLLGHYVQVAHMPETDRLWNTICQWWPEIEVLIVTGVTIARTEAANTSIKNIKRTRRGFRNPANYKAHIPLRSAAKRAA